MDRCQPGTASSEHSSAPSQLHRFSLNSAPLVLPARLLPETADIISQGAKTFVYPCLIKHAKMPSAVSMTNSKHAALLQIPSQLSSFHC